MNEVIFSEAGPRAAASGPPAAPRAHVPAPAGPDGGAAPVRPAVPGAGAPTGTPTEAATGAVTGTDVAWRFRRAALRIEEHITRLYPPAPSGVECWLSSRAASGLGPGTADLVARRLHRTLAAPVRHLVDAGGRRWRPGLIAEMIDLLGGDSEHYGPLCAATELTHTGSLMVDDVQDGSPLRRGIPAVHSVLGVAAALNAGTNAYFALDRAIALTTADDPALAGRLREVYLAALRTAHAGQALDIEGHRAEMEQAVATGDAGPVRDLVLLTHRLKSGALVSAGSEAAALVTGAGPGTRGALAAFGDAVGTAYQITDDVADLLGVTRDGTATKRVAEDARNGKVTMPLALAVPLLPAPRLRELWHLVRDPGADDRRLEEVRDTLTDCGATDACRREADALLERSWRELEPLLPAGPRTRTLRDMAWYTVHGDRVA
ncbi:polyprenyl synthetase family protein [Streptomyces tagetis]|uniref:Polyprenyl synthetase family protein n=1 Tax=Streptomyces tagetis TaxID=2820809 RepID=A0A940XF22_9ACTN|nr:polyprenyl synthetase family protein [Streptomyces sp. RG38]MBQ0825441.1 polyprenyl synthetase family protein [Streptomyces sp. RG38]